MSTRNICCSESYEKWILSRQDYLSTEVLISRLIRISRCAQLGTRGFTGALGLDAGIMLFN
jgi:hypothetical protein